MSKQRTGVGNTNERASSSPFTIEVQISQARQDCWQYTWDRERARLCLSGIHQGHPDLPAVLATLRLEEREEVPVYVLVAHSIAPGTRVAVQVIGALQALFMPEEEADLFPLANWASSPGMRAKNPALSCSMRHTCGKRQG